MHQASHVALAFVCINFAQALLFAWLPLWSRADIYFSITVPTTFRDSAEGQRILKWYRLYNFLQAIAGSVMALGLIWLGRTSIAVAGVFWTFVGCRLDVQWARKQVKPHHAQPATRRESDLRQGERWVPGDWLLYLGPFIVLATAALAIDIHWDDIPSRFPIHRGLDGSVNSWGIKSFPGTYFLVIAGALICLCILLLAMWTWRSAPRTPVPWRFGNDREAHVRRRIFHLALAQYGVAVALSCVAGPLPTLGFSAVAPIISVAILTLCAALLLERPDVPQGGPAPAGAPTGDYTLDRCWKAGVFYFNREDPAVVVERRFGLGYTLNFGHTLSWFIAAAVAAILAFLVTR